MEYPSFYYRLYFRLVNYMLDHIKLVPQVSSQSHCFLKKEEEEKNISLIMNQNARH